MYMCSSVAVRAGSLRFKEEGVKDIVRGVFLPWFNAYRFFVQEATRYEMGSRRFSVDYARSKASMNVIDRWIRVRSHALLKFVREEMEAYRLYTVVPCLRAFLDDLTNWYVRLNRGRMRGSKGPDQTIAALCTLYEVLLNMTVLLAPVTPFLAEMIYRNLAKALPEGHPLKAASVHFVMTRELDWEPVDQDIIRAVAHMVCVVKLGRACRQRRSICLKTPLRSMVVMSGRSAVCQDVQALQAYIKEELRVTEVVYGAERSRVSRRAVLKFGALGKRLGSDMKAVHDAVRLLSQEQLTAFEHDGQMTVCGHRITADEMRLTWGAQDLGDPNLESCSRADTLVIMDFKSF